MAVTVAGSRIVAEVEKFLGQPYKWGGIAPGGFDCSGLVQYVLEQVGVADVPRTSEEQYAWAIPVNQPQPGDLVFAQFPGDSQASPGHVGVYTGDGRVLSAEDPQSGIQYSQVSDWEPYIVGYGRVPGAVPGQGTAGTGTAAAEGCPLAALTAIVRLAGVIWG